MTTFNDATSVYSNVINSTHHNSKTDKKVKLKIEIFTMIIIRTIFKIQNLLKRSPQTEKFPSRL